MSTDHQPSVDQLLTGTSVKYRPTINQQVSAKSRRSVGERKAISAETHLERLSTVSRPSVDPLSTDYRPLYRPTVDRVSTECRPSIDRLSTEYRPTVDGLSTDYRPSVDRYIDQLSTDISVDITHSKQDPSFLRCLHD